MSRSIATARDHRLTRESSFDAAEPPTRPLHGFCLVDEARRLERLEAAEEDATVTIGAEDSRRLLARVFAPGAERGPRPSSDDEPTLDAPVPALALEALRAATEAAAAPPEPVRPTRPPPLRELVFTRPPPPSRARPAVSPAAVIAHVAPAPQLAVAPRASEACALAQPWRSDAEPPVWPARRSAQTWVVAGIWATALSLVAALMVIASSG